MGAAEITSRTAGLTVLPPGGPATPGLKETI